MNQRRSASSATVVSDEPLLLAFLCLPTSRAQRTTAAGVGERPPESPNTVSHLRCRVGLRLCF